MRRSELISRGGPPVNKLALFLFERRGHGQNGGRHGVPDFVWQRECRLRQTRKSGAGLLLLSRAVCGRWVGRMREDKGGSEREKKGGVRKSFYIRSPVYSSTAAPWFRIHPRFIHDTPKRFFWGCRLVPDRFFSASI